MTCLHCYERLPDPDLWDAIVGFQSCAECETERMLEESERREAVWAVEQKLHLLSENITKDKEPE